MDFKIEIQSWNGQWRFGVELEHETIATGILSTFVQCSDKCKEIIEEEIADIEADGDTFNPCDVAILGGDPSL